MSKEPISEGDEAVSRRRLLEKAALVVGVATSVVAARTALARSSDVVIDSAGRVLINGAALPAQRLEGCFETAASNGGNCTNKDSCTKSTNAGSCSNQKTCVAPTRAMQSQGAAPKANAPVAAPKANGPGGGGSHK
jgi:hypothetical protein